ncbi:hypothetical protein [Microbulbifer sp.]|uniref:hypothetical protein n=1 Tax=Microbulbifer sp. TaxID=1908541 RepID=UPI003F3DF202
MTKNNCFILFFLALLADFPLLALATPTNIVVTPTVSTDGSFTVTWDNLLQPGERCIDYQITVVGNNSFRENQEWGCSTEPYTTFTANGYPPGEYEIELFNTYDSSETGIEYFTASPVTAIVTGTDGAKKITRLSVTPDAIFIELADFSDSSGLNCDSKTTFVTYSSEDSYQAKASLLISAYLSGAPIEIDYKKCIGNYTSIYAVTMRE